MKFGRSMGEPHYNRIKPCIIAEELLDCRKQPIPSSSLIDYKIWSFDGKPAYKLARKGQDVAIRAKTLVIDEIEVVECGLPDEPTLVLRVVCSKGTYIRALARDIGEALGSGAHLYGLRRTQVGNVRVEQCESLEGILNRLETEEMVSAEEAEQHMLEQERIANRERAAAMKARQAARKKEQKQKQQ